MQKFISFFRNLFRKPATGGIVSRERVEYIPMLNPSPQILPEALVKAILESAEDHSPVGVSIIRDEVFCVLKPCAGGMVPQLNEPGIKFIQVNEDPCV